ncbi:MAG: acylphosphatase [Catalinimonas sp.]
MKRSVLVRVRGRVQGVSFRASTQSKARRLGLSGWVRNEPDGQTVLVEAHGPAARVDELIEWCRRGPRLARVDGVDVSEAAPAAHKGFRITR